MTLFSNGINLSVTELKHSNNLSKHWSSNKLAVGNPFGLIPNFFGTAAFYRQ